MKRKQRISWKRRIPEVVTASQFRHAWLIRLANICGFIRLMANDHEHALMSHFSVGAKCTLKVKGDVLVEKEVRQEVIRLVWENVSPEQSDWALKTDRVQLKSICSSLQPTPPLQRRANETFICCFPHSILLLSQVSSPWSPWSLITSDLGSCGLTFCLSLYLFAGLQNNYRPSCDEN